MFLHKKRVWKPRISLFTLFFCYLFIYFFTIYIYMSRNKIYNEIAVDSFQLKGGGTVEYILRFLMSVISSIVNYYIHKWLDHRRKDS